LALTSSFQTTAATYDVKPHNSYSLDAVLALVMAGYLDREAKRKRDESRSHLWIVSRNAVDNVSVIKDKILHRHNSLEKIMTSVTLELPEEIFSALRRSPTEFVQELRLVAAIYWYQRGEISQEKASNIAGLDRTDFLMALSREQVDAFIVDFDDLQREFDRG
jgi:predicted HTH domain antitoxin